MFYSLWVWSEIINIRYLFSLIFNLIALLVSIKWCLAKNNPINIDELHYESILSTVTLLATLLGLNFLNDRLGKPTIKLKLKSILVVNGFIQKKAICLDIVNHSLMKVFISYIQIDIKENGEIFSMNFLVDGTTQKAFYKIELDPGQKFSFNMTLEQIYGCRPNLKFESINKLKVTTDTGHVFKINGRTVQKYFQNVRI